jgi:hypothetical protein
MQVMLHCPLCFDSILSSSGGVEVDIDVIERLASDR